MNALKNNERGLSLVEVTIMLLVLMLLTGVLAPSIFDFVNDAKWVKVKEDCEAIGLSVARLTRDVGPCLKFRGSESCTKNNRVDLLHSDGPVVDGQSLGQYAGAVRNSNLKAGQLNWDYDRTDSMENQFVTNGSESPYGTPVMLGTSSSVGPQTGLGWRGAYLSPPISADPWGHMYLVNSAFLATASDATLGGPRGGGHDGEGSRNQGNHHTNGDTEGSIWGGWSYDTFCISSGPNGVYETPIGGSGNGGVLRLGDDFVFVISGGTR